MDTFRTTVQGPFYWDVNGGGQADRVD